ncbi:hypothetical protein Dsin_031608 [Dipteronia sinensis]|uniref:Gnk2-homologous domain-containing protein n=1 Tax=Dipteronia sinensis TaxID=43782 RepID=A0AAE0DSK3_9ROSI|nr:hypothetical protein Dsin_031608 [Dipteronia sinensis]
MQSLKLTAIHLFFISCLFHVFDPTESQNITYYYCDTGSNYTSGSVFEQNLNLTLTSLASNASVTGFFTTEIGQNLNTVYGLVLCRGDISDQDCQSCASTASIEIIKQCSNNNKEAAIGYDNCLLRYSDWRFFYTVDSSPKLMAYNENNVTDPVVFKLRLGDLLRTLSSNAASSISKFSVGQTNFSDFQNINAMLQCTRDLAGNSCSNCLQDIIRYIPQFCNGKEGCRVFSLSCNLRFEIYPFFLLSSPPPASLVQPNSSSQNEKKSTSKVIVFVAIPVAATMAVALIVCCCFFWRNGKNKRAWQLWTNGTAIELLDPVLLGGRQLPKLEVLKCIHIGLLCVQEAAADRPTMSQIVMMLSNHTMTAPPPSRPAFFVSQGGPGSNTRLEDSRTSQSDKSSQESLQQSVNEVTITELDPR